MNLVGLVLMNSKSRKTLIESGESAQLAGPR